MSKILVYTDCDFSDELLNKYDIDYLPYLISLDNKVIESNMNWNGIDVKEFFDNLKENRVKPAQYPLGVMMQKINNYSEDSTIITSHSKMSAGYSVSYATKNVVHKDYKLLCSNTIGSGSRLFIEDFINGDTEGVYHTFWFVPSSKYPRQSGRIYNVPDNECAVVLNDIDDKLQVVDYGTNVEELFERWDSRLVESYNISYSVDLPIKSREYIKNLVINKLNNINLRDESLICPIISTVVGPGTFSIGVKLSEKE